MSGTVWPTGRVASADEEERRAWERGAGQTRQALCPQGGKRYWKESVINLLK